MIHLVADGKDAIQSFYLIVGIYDDATSTTDEFRIKISHSFSSHTTHPDEGARGDLRTVFQDDAMVLIVGHHLVEQHIDAHGAKEGFDMRRSGRTHGR